MAITYPLTLPTTPVPSRMVMRALNSTAISKSPFTSEQQVFEHQGGIWTAEMSLPPMERADAEAWISTMLKLRGLNGTFLLPTYSAKVPRGIATGSPQVDGDGQTGLTLATLGWTASQTGILKAGDYLQVMKNYLTKPEEFDHADWVKVGGGGGSPPTVTPNATAAPDGTTTADQIDFPATGAAETSSIQQNTFAAIPSVVNQQFAFLVFMRAASSISINLIINDGITFVEQTKNLTTSWQAFLVNHTADPASTLLTVRIRNPASQAAKTVFAWGASVTSPQESHLHKVLNDADSDANGLATFDIWPRLRTDPKDHADIIVQTPVGIFRIEFGWRGLQQIRIIQNLIEIVVQRHSFPE